MTFNKLYSFFLLLLGLLLIACNGDSFVNPYDLIEVPESADSSIIAPLDPISIEGLHANIFKPTCANSGCHDGTFEPDYRTIESTYNTLVYQPAIKKDAEGNMEYRVVPGKPETSILMARLNYDIDGNSGIMPLAIEPDSDWTEKKEAYLNNLEDWIKGGAKDLFGNLPALGNSLPQMQGVDAFSDQWLSRGEGNGALKLKVENAIVDLYVALSDEETPPTELTSNTIKFSNTQDGFANASEMNLEVLSNPIQRLGFNGAMVSYYHKISLKPTELGNARETIFFRVYTKDKDNPITEIPADGGASEIKEYFSFKLL